MQQESTQHNSKNIHSQRNRKDNTNNKPNHRETKEYSDDCTRTLYGRVIMKLDRLTYMLEYYMLCDWPMGN